MLAENIFNLLSGDFRTHGVRFIELWVSSCAGLPTALRFLKRNSEFGKGNPCASVFLRGQISREAIGAPAAARWIHGPEIFLDRVAHGSDDSSISVKVQNPNRKLFLWPMAAIVLGAFAAVNPFYQPNISPFIGYPCGLPTWRWPSLVLCIRRWRGRVCCCADCFWRCRVFSMSDPCSASG